MAGILKLKKLEQKTDILQMTSSNALKKTHKKRMCV